MRERRDERSAEGGEEVEEMRRAETGGRRELRSSRKSGGMEGGGTG